MQEANNLFDCDKYPLRHWIKLEYLGLLALASYCLLKLATPQGLGRFFEAIVLFGFFFSLYYHRVNPLRIRTFQLLLLAILLPLVEFGINYFIDPEMALRYQADGSLYRLMFFLPLAWWLAGRYQMGLWAYFLSFIGLYIAIFSSGSFAAEWQNLLAGHRVEFGFRDAQHSGLLFATAVLGLLVFAYRMIYQSKINTYACSVLVSLVLALSIIILINSQARASWLGLIVAVAIYVSLVVFHPSFRRQKLSCSYLLALCTLVLAMIFAVTWKFDTLKSRMQVEADTISQLFHEDLSIIQLENNSVGLRIKLWRAAWERIVEKPLLGWGYGIRTSYVKESESLPNELRLHGPQHVHNSYLALLLSYGFLGLAFVVFLFAYLLRLAWLQYRAQCLPWDCFLFVVLFTILFAIVNFFESFLFMRTGLYLVGIVYSVPYTLELRRFFAATNRQKS